MIPKKEMEAHKKIILKNKLVTNQISSEWSKNRYLLPIPKDRLKEYGVKNSAAHIGNLSNSIDFTVAEGTEVYAAADGVVVEIKDDSNVGGGDPKYWNDGNYIIIRHENEEYTQYEHLKFKGVLVNVGEKVKQGQLIGYSGNTGYSHYPHLHFEVQKYFSKDDYVTLKARLKNFENPYSK